jgi:hypothetical protein
MAWGACYWLSICFVRWAAVAFWMIRMRALKVLPRDRLALKIYTAKNRRKYLWRARDSTYGSSASQQHKSNG